jgi:hypothetical protein
MERTALPPMTRGHDHDEWDAVGHPEHDLEWRARVPVSFIEGSHRFGIRPVGSITLRARTIVRGRVGQWAYAACHAATGFASSTRVGARAD